MRYVTRIKSSAEIRVRARLQACRSEGKNPRLQARLAAAEAAVILDPFRYV